MHSFVGILKFSHHITRSLVCISVNRRTDPSTAALKVLETINNLESIQFLAIISLHIGRGDNGRSCFSNKGLFGLCDFVVCTLY